MSDSTQTEAPNMMPRPTTQHRRLEPFAGQFRSEVKMWMGSGDPYISTGTMTNSWQVDDLFLHQDYVGDASQGAVPAFRGQGFWGFNTTTGHYEGFWIDNASTMMQMESGDVDESGKIWTMHSEVRCSRTGVKMKKRSVITLIDNHHHKIEMFFTGADGNEMKAMEINYTRA